MNNDNNQETDTGTIVEYNRLLSLVIPCYNESKRIGTTLSALAEFDAQWQGAYEVIIVDDGSTDNTAGLLKESLETEYAAIKSKVRIEILPANQGKGNALKHGVSLAAGDFILTLDADMSTKPTELINWKKRNPAVLSDNNTIFIGSRQHEEGEVEALQSRKIIGEVFNAIVQVFTSMELRDTQCGFKLYPAAMGKMLFADMRNKGWAHDVEVLHKASLNGANIVEMPITWINQPESKVHVFKDSARMLMSVIGLSLRTWFGNTFVLPFRLPELATPDQRTNIRLRGAFNILSTLLILVMPLMSFQFAITGDEHWHYDYGNDIINYFLHGDRTAQKTTTGIQYYGGIFDFLTASVYHIFHFWSHYKTMHFVNALVGAIGIIYAGRIGKLFGGWSAGIITMVLLVCSPSWFGHNFANPKDIPFSVGYTATLYYIFQYLRVFPRPSFHHLLGLVCSIGWALGVRIGGLLLIAYLVLFVLVYALATNQAKKSLNGDLIRQVIIIGILGYGIALICWPYSHINIIAMPLKALNVMSHFFITISMVYEGQDSLSSLVPWYYIPRYILYTAPVLVLVTSIAGLISVPVLFRKNKQLLLFSAFLLFTICFPVVYAVIQKSSLYDGWRHFLFIYPPICIFAALGLNLLVANSSKGARYAGVALLIIGIFPPLKFSAQNHPMEALYYNEIAGGLKGIYGKYETDYYMLGIQPAAEWLAKEVPAGTKVEIGTNCTYPLQEYLKPYKNMRITYMHARLRYKADWDYYIMYSRFTDAGQLQSGKWPSADVVHTVMVDGVPVAAVLKRRTHKDFVGLNLFTDKKLDSAKVMLLESIKEYPQNEVVWAILAQIYEMQDNDSLYYAARNAIEFNPANDEMYELMGTDLLKRDQTAKALEIFRGLEKYKPAISHYLCAYAYAVNNQVNEAFAELDISLAIDPYYEDTYHLALQIAKTTNSPGRLEEYYEKYKKAFDLIEEESQINGDHGESESTDSTGGSEENGGIKKGGTGTDISL